MKQVRSINDCETIEEAKKLLNDRYNEWYSKPSNREKRLEYYKEYYRKRKNKTKGDEMRKKYKKEKIGNFEIISYESECKTQNYDKVKEFIQKHIVFDLLKPNKKRTSYGLKHTLEDILGSYVSNYDVKCAMAELGIRGWHYDPWDINYCYPISEKEYKKLDIIKEFLEIERKTK